MLTGLNCTFRPDLCYQTSGLQQKSYIMDTISITSNNIQIKRAETNLAEQSINIQLKSIQSPQSITSLAIKEELFDNTDWQETMNQNKTSDTSQEVIIDEEEWKEDWVDSFEEDQLQIIPIVVKDHNHYVIEYVKIIKIGSENSFMGVGIQFCITKQFLDTYHGRFCKKKLLAPDVINLIMDYCAPLLKVSSIHLDADYISYQHQLLVKSSESIHYIDIDPFKPFLSNLEITTSAEGLYLNFECGEALNVPSEWSDDDDNATHSA